MSCPKCDKGTDTKELEGVVKHVNAVIAFLNNEDGSRSSYESYQQYVTVDSLKALRNKALGKIEDIKEKL